MADLQLSGIVQPRSKKTSVTGFRIDASIRRAVPVTPGDDETIEIAANGSGVVDDDGAFTLTIGGEGEPSTPIRLTVSTGEGVMVAEKTIPLDDAAKPISLRVAGTPTLDIAASGGTKGAKLSLTGRVVDARGTTVPAGLPVVLWGVRADDPSTQPAPAALVITRTQAGGFFSGDWTPDRLTSAFGRISGGEPVPIPLEEERLPRRVLLVLELPQAVLDDAEDGPPGLAPMPADLTNNPAAYSQDLGGGCVDLTTPNRTVEEFIYTMVVRTSEPDVKGVTLGVRRMVPPRLVGRLIEAITLQEVYRSGSIRAAPARELEGLHLDVETATHLVATDEPPTMAELQRASWLSEIGRLKDLIGTTVSTAPVRQVLDADHPIDWDDTPTIFQAITLARGHLIEFREVWRADGYSLGDLLHSLPLAPGQRRRVAVVDWERRTTTARTESLEFEESLEAFNSRDRDVSEIVGSRLSEEIAAGSNNTTWGSAGGIGAGFIGTGFGIFGGVAGSSGGSSSNSWSDASRQFAGESLQSLRDRVLQRASSVRDQRATVVQTVSQGETMRAESEVVANYNHCHAMTIEYFEVLRHFLITHEVADVRECLFVPLPMAAFDRAKLLRWQTPLTARLRDRSLLPAFDATRRIADNWEGWDYPVSRYSEEPPELLEGELRISFILPRPRDAEDGAFQVDMWNPYSHWLPGDAFEMWTRWIQEGIAEYNATQIARRDRQFRERVAPEIARRIVDGLRFWYVTEDAGEVEVPLDPTLVSRYAEGTPLYVSLRPRGALPALPREGIAQFKITLEVPRFLGIPIDILPPDAQVVVQSGKARYSTAHKQFVLFDEGRILNDLSASDAVYIATPTSWAETRNPRQEDRELSDRLVAHLNNALEHYHQAIWTWLDAERRFMLLDGILVPGMGGRSVASIVENRLIGIAGNSLIFPVAPGIRVDPRVNTDSEGDLGDLYAADVKPAIRISVPTRGVYAEAILGDCDGCEEIDDSRYWRWSAEGMLEPPAIEPVGTESRTDGETALTPTPLPAPLVQIQNAPDLPAPFGLAEVFKVLARPDIFTDITGLEGTQRNARAAFDAALSAASSVASQAADLAKQNITATSGERMLERINQARSDGLLGPGAAQELSEKVLNTMVGQPSATADKKADSPVADPEVKKVIEKAAQSESGNIKVQTPDETLEMKFDGGDVKVGAGSSTVGLFEVDEFIDQLVIAESFSGSNDKFTISRTVIPTIAGLRSAFGGMADVEPAFVRPNPADTAKYQVRRRLRIAYPADPADPDKVVADGRLPVVVIVHGQHLSWEGGVEVRNHDGYSYLQEHLAKLGIVSVSVDENAANFFDSLIEMRAKMTLGAIDALRAMNADSASRFHDRLDFDKIGLVGHSRGGDAVIQAALLNTGNAHGVIKAVAAIAPTDFTGALLDSAKRLRVDAARAGFLFVMYGGHDADVSGIGGARSFTGTGFRHYDRATAPKAMGYLPFCNHNRFNRTWAADEAEITDSDLLALHSRLNHEALANEFLGALFEWHLLGVTARQSLFNGVTGNALGFGVSQQWWFGSTLKIIDSFETASAPTGTRTIAVSEIAPMPDVKAAGTAIELHTSHQTKILAVNENVTAAPPAPTPRALDLALAAAHRDWKGFDVLTFRVGTAVDLTDAGTVAGGVSQPTFEILLIDGAGKTETIASSSFLTSMAPGAPVFHELAIRDSAGTQIGTENVSLHRLGTVRVPLAGMTVDLGDIRRLVVVPPVALAQRLFVDSLGLVKT